VVKRTSFALKHGSGNILALQFQLKNEHHYNLAGTKQHKKIKSAKIRITSCLSDILAKRLFVKKA